MLNWWLTSLSAQAVWQAGKPMAVNVDFDVPAHGANEEARVLKEAAAAEAKLTHMRKQLRQKSLSFLSLGTLDVNTPPFPVVNVIAEAALEGQGASEARSFLSKGAFAKDQLSQQRASLQKRWQDEVEKQKAVFAAVLGHGAAVAPSHALLEAKTRAAEMTALRHDITRQVVRMQAGGRQAAKALSHLNSLVASTTEAKQIMKAAGVEAAAVRLMQSPASDDALQGLAGSILTQLSGQPVASELADEQSGADGQVHIVLPRPSRIYEADEVMSGLDAGVRPSALV